MADRIRTTMRSNALLLLPLAIGGATAAATWLLATRLHASPGIAIIVAPLVGMGAGWLASTALSSRAVAEVEVSADAVRIGQRSFSLAEGAARLRGREVADWMVIRTLEVTLLRKKGKRATLPVQDLHALLTYFDRNDGLRGPLEAEAWGMVDRGEKDGSKGPELKVWVAEGRVVRGEFVAVRGRVTPDPDERAPLPDDAACYLVPTRFGLPSQGRAWLKTEVERAKRAAGETPS
jgi:hypothetical protein